jgi:hypothetical protein
MMGEIVMRVLEEEIDNGRDDAVLEVFLLESVTEG